MFESKLELSPFLVRAGLAHYAGVMERLCVPGVCFAAAASEAGAAPVGGSRIGGAPELPASIAWPWREAYEQGEMIARMLGRDQRERAAAFVSPQPLSFIAQIDLEEVARLEVLSDRLPGSGRLLFFWDSICGHGIATGEATRVIWDTTPRDALAASPAPPALVQSAGSPPMEGLYPSLPVACRAIWCLPDFLLLDEMSDDEMRAILDDEDHAEVWDKFMENGASVLASGRRVLTHRLCGWPIPEQDDPRLTAAIAAGRTSRPFDRLPTSAEREEARSEMHAWTLLLQVGLRDLWSGLFEGSLYFVMREGDLAARDFTRVHAICQRARRRKAAGA